MVFVFGSNLAGIHGAGAARYALMHHGAKYGQAVGRQGDAYAIPTKDASLRTLPLWEIRMYVDMFLGYARHNPDTEFKVTRVGCGLAGLDDSYMADMFREASSNCYFDEAWRVYLGESHKYWGTY